jgi:hypothetical protein
MLDIGDPGKHIRLGEARFEMPSIFHKNDLSVEMWYITYAYHS